jgi:hypothetical protein
MEAHSYTRRVLLASGAASVLLGWRGPELAAEPPSPKGDGQSDSKTIVIPVEGMVCFACAATVKGGQVS